MKLLLTAIFKGDSEYDMAKRMLESFMPHFKGLCVAITGLESHEKLIKLIKKHKGLYVETSPETHPKIYSKDGDKYFFSNFAEARNESFKLASELQKTEHFDWWSWADVDDILVAGEELQKAAQVAKERKADHVFFSYWYSVNVKEDGTFTDKDVNIFHQRERLLIPDMFKWISRLHEVSVPIDGNYKPKHLVYDYSPKEERTCVWAHITDIDRVGGAMERNIKILETQAREENHKDPRTLFYLAKTYFDMNKKEFDDLSEQLLMEYLELSGWQEERASAWQYIGDIWLRRNNRARAIESYHEAIKEYPNRHMPYLLLSREYSLAGLPEHSDFWLDSVVMKMEEPKARTTIGNPLEVRFMAASLKYNQCIRKQDIDGAIQWMTTRNKLVGKEDDGMIKTLEEAKLYNQAGGWIFNYAKWLRDNGKSNLVPYLLQALSPDHKKEPFAQLLATEFAEPKKWDIDEIAYFASNGGPHFETWDTESLKKGIGGSETAVIQLSREWVKLGFKVTVFCETENEGDQDGVTYKHWSQLNWNDEFNILILWRSPHLLDKQIKAKKLFMDLHDIASQPDWSEKRMERIDKVFFKSNWHRTHIPKLPDSKAVVISNGIEV